MTQPARRRKRATHLLCFGAACALALLACDSDDAGGSDVVGGDTVAVGDTVSGDVTPPSNWTCLGAVDPPDFRDGNATVTLTVAAFPSNDPLPAVDVKVCAIADRACDAPLDSGTSDATGQLVVRVPTDAATYYQLTGEAVTPSLFFRRGLPPATDPFAITLGALTPGVLDTFAAIAGATLDPARGHLVLTGRDCDAALAAGVTFEIPTVDAATTVAYIRGVLPNTMESTTDPSGRAGALNLTPGDVVVTGRRAADEALIGTRDFFVAAGWTSFVGVVPN